jgi:hypothetical protein
VLRFVGPLIFCISVLTSPLSAQVPRVEQGNTATDIGQGINSFLRGMNAARAQRDSELLAIAPDLIAAASLPDTIRARWLSRLLPVQLQSLRDASEQILQRFTLRPEQAVALRRLDGDISLLLAQ